MSKKNTIDAWFNRLSKIQKLAQLNGGSKDTPHIVIGYGSLMSEQSRAKFSNINSLALPVTVNGWERAWVTRSSHERQTYVGAYKCDLSHFNAQAFFTNIDKQLQQREQDYCFCEVELSSLSFQMQLTDVQTEILSSMTFYICETLLKQQPDSDFPVCDSYIDTCLAGCMEVGGSDEVRRFIATTKYWPITHKRRDRGAHFYPRSAVISAQNYTLFDEIQKSEGFM